MGFIEIKKHTTKLYEIIKHNFLVKTSNELAKQFWLTLYNKYQGKTIWIITDKIDLFESYGFKKLKTLDKKWQQKPGLVLEEIVKNSKKTTGFALRIKIPKANIKITPIPNFILIDGGKGQLSVVNNIFKENNWEYKNKHFSKFNHQIIVCSIAKREEEIFFPNQSNPYNLPANCEGSFLLQRLRDEAHRFAVTYNRNLRTKTTLKSELDNIPGIGPSVRKKLIKTFGSVEGVKNASFDNLKLCVGEKIANKILYFSKNSLN